MDSLIFLAGFLTGVTFVFIVAMYLDNKGVI